MDRELLREKLIRYIAKHGRGKAADIAKFCRINPTTVMKVFKGGSTHESTLVLIELYLKDAERDEKKAE